MPAAVPLMERRIVSVLFADLVGFTSLSEDLDAEDVASIQDAYFAGVRDAVTRYSGRVEKFIGDAAVAAFGVARTREDDPERAVRCGLALTAMVDALGGRLGLDVEVLRLRVGVNTGEVALTVDGADEGRLTGDAMNVAARLQATADPGTVLCGEATVLAAAHAVRFGDLVPYQLKGKAEPVRAAPAISARATASREAAMGTIGAPTIGRASELASLIEAAARVAAGTAERWTVVAPPGTGKSRLIDETAVHLEADRVATAVLRVRVRPDATTPLEVVGGLVRQTLGGEPGARARLAASALPPGRRAVLISELESILAAPAPLPPDDRPAVRPSPPSARSAVPTRLADERSELFAAWLEILDVLAGDRRQVWLVEDVHWASGDVLALVDAAGTTPSAHGRLVIATARPSLLDSAPAWVDRPAARRLDLSPLTEEAAEELLERLVGRALPAALTASVVKRADGNPLFVEELVRTWVSVGVLVAADGGWQLAVEPAHVPLPTTVQAVYAAQLDDLPADARTVARHASVAGRRFPSGALRALDVLSDEGRDGLETLGRRGFIDGPSDMPPVGAAYGFRHALLRDAGYASLARAHRAKLHVQLARWLESLVTAGASASLAETIGRHYADALAALPALAGGLAGDLDRTAIARRAARWLEDAAEEALATAAYDAASSLLTASIEVTPPEDRIDRARRLGQLGEVLAPSAGTDVALQRLEEARRGFAELIGLERDEAARVGYAMASAAAARLLIERLTFRGASRLASDALAVLGGGRDLIAAPLLLARAQADAFESNVSDSAVEVADQVRALAIAANDRALELDALRLKQVALAESGTIDEALSEEVATLAADLGRWPMVVSIRINQAMACLGGRSAEAWPLLEAAETLAAAHGLTESRAWIAQCRAEAAFYEGDWDAALGHGEDALRIAEERAYHRAAVRTWFVIRPIAAYRGDRRLLASMRRWFGTRDDFPDSPYGRLMHAAVDLDVQVARAEPPTPPDPGRLRAWSTFPFDDATVIAARDRIFDGWLQAGMGAEIRAALAAVTDEQEPDPLSRGDHRLWEAELARADGRPAGIIDAQAREALRDLRDAASPPWIARAIRLLEGIGTASAAERNELAATEARLRGAPDADAGAAGSAITSTHP